MTFIQRRSNIGTTSFITSFITEFTGIKMLNVEDGETEDREKTNSDSVSNLNLFYRTLHEIITDFRMSREELNDIQEAVEEIVWQYADTVATIEPRFKAKSIHGVGSFYEGTKILKIDEFDFLYIIDELSNDALIEMEKIQVEDVLGVAVRIKNVDHFKDSKWLLDTDGNGDSYLSMLNFLPAKAAFYIKSPHESFSDVLSRAAESFRSQSLSSKKSSGTLSLMGQELKAGPNVELWFEWQSFKGDWFGLKADITPVIRGANLPDMISEEECEHIPYLTQLHTTGSYLVMPSKFRHMMMPYTFSPTFTETERDLMKDLNQSHRMAYQCLKFLLLDLYTRRNPLYCDLHTFLIPAVYPDVELKDVLKKLDYLTHKSFLSSYCLKTAVLLHARDCQLQQNPELCSLDVMSRLLGCVCRQHPTLSSIFLKQDNLFWKLSQLEHKKDRELLINLLTMLQSFHQRVSQKDYKLTEAAPPANIFRETFALLMQMAEDCGIQAVDTLLEFNPMSIGIGPVYGTYKFTKETESILEDTEMEPLTKKFLLNEAKTFYNFDTSSKYSTIASSIEKNYDTLKHKLTEYESSVKAVESKYDDKRQHEHEDDTTSATLRYLNKSDRDGQQEDHADETSDVTVLYSRV